MVVNVKLGLKSTILDLSVQPPSIRRLGAISQTDLEDFIPYFGESTTPTSGTHAAHYAPYTSLLLSKTQRKISWTSNKKALQLPLLILRMAKIMPKNCMQNFED